MTATGLGRAHQDPADREPIVIWQLTRVCDLVCRGVMPDANPDEPGSFPYPDGVAPLTGVGAS